VVDCSDFLDAAHGALQHKAFALEEAAGPAALGFSDNASSRRAMYSAACRPLSGSPKIAGLSTPAIAACSTALRL
jgi:hypothetical protein